MEDSRRKIDRELSDRLGRLEERMESVEKVTEDMQALNVKLDTLIQIFDASRGFITIVRGLGTFIKWAGGIAAVVGAAYFAVKGGK